MTLDNPVTSSATRFDKCINDKTSLTANVAKLVSQANPRREYALYINLGSTPITLILGDITAGVAVGKGIPLLSYGSSYTINVENLYTGKVGAIAAGAAELSFVDCST